ncbi:MAG TPA: endo-1,4-beta-xylanase, partial [Flavisolibacter sp.]|nr:endo-1,4-beta-xylanase [Flavisolibacter sp.]
MIRIFLIAQAVFLFACKKDTISDSEDLPLPEDTITSLKDAAKFPIGVAISYTPMLNDTRYAATVKRDFNSVTFDYHMKHGAIVKNDGTLDFTQADQLVNAASAGGLEVFGHTLGWHQNQNATYLKAVFITSLGNEMLTNGGFESMLTSWGIWNTGDPAGSATISASNDAAEVHSGTGAMKVVNTKAYPDNQWRVQVASPLVATTVGKEYAISYWVKATTPGGSIRLSSQDNNQGNAQYQSDQTIGTNWQKITWNIQARAVETRFLFDMGQAANTYFIDDVSIKEIRSSSTDPQTASAVDNMLNNYVTGMVNHFKGKVKAWDVVNELFADDGSIRNNSNTSTAASDVFVWSNYLGEDYALKAFSYAKTADPDALLYINDYGLETNTAKLDALIALVTKLRSQGAKVDGIGTQMHIAANTPKAGIDRMMQKLAATGLKVRVSELDVTTGNGGTPGTPPGTVALANQAAMYKYVVSSYLKNVPEAQRAGITVWGLSDNTSWLYNNGTQYPLLYDQNYNKKPAYESFL